MWGLVCSLHTIVPLMPSVAAERQRRERYWSIANHAMHWSGTPAPVVIVAVHVARTMKRRSGWIVSGRRCCRSTIFWSLSLCRESFALWLGVINVWPMMHCSATETLKQFGRDPKYLGAEIGMTAVLHTHSRRLNYHPHLHVVVPGGGIDPQERVWKRTRYRYLFNEFALAMVFRGKFLAELAKAGLSVPRSTPKEWVVDCRLAGRGEAALKYLSRYLYRGVVAESNILCDQDGEVTFGYTDGESGEHRTETLPGERFLWRVIQHVLPKGYHRVRNFGFLHHNARKQLQLVQLILQVMIAPKEEKVRPHYHCRQCGKMMKVVAVRNRHQQRLEMVIRRFNSGPGPPLQYGLP